MKVKQLYIFFAALLIWTMHSREIFLKHSQSQEDQDLRYFFGGVENGYYLDIGAYDPHYISTTANLYSQGWDGINVDAGWQRLNRFFYLRPETTSLNVAIGPEDEYVQLSELNDDSTSTINPEFKQFQMDIRSDLKEKNIANVPSISMKQLCKRYFLRKPMAMNLDVEGSEIAVLKSNDWENDTCRPEIAVI
jgi:FkbM family methyltransferase